jgi:hypothetical protein
MVSPIETLLMAHALWRTKTDNMDMMRGLVTIVCLAAILAVALTPAALAWLAVLVAPVILLTAIMPDSPLRANPLFQDAQPQSLLCAISGRAPPLD